MQFTKEFRTALSLHPLSPIMNLNYAIALRIAGQRDASMAQFQKLVERDPSFLGAHLYQSEFCAMEGHFTDAVAEMQKFNSAAGSWNPDAQGYLRGCSRTTGPSRRTSPWPMPLPARARKASNISTRPFPTKTRNSSPSFGIPAGHPCVPTPLCQRH